MLCGDGREILGEEEQRSFWIRETTGRKNEMENNQQGQNSGFESVKM